MYHKSRNFSIKANTARFTRSLYAYIKTRISIVLNISLPFEVHVYNELAEEKVASNFNWIDSKGNSMITSNYTVRIFEIHIGPHPNYFLATVDSQQRSPIVKKICGILYGVFIPWLQKRRRYLSTVEQDLPLELSRPPACRATGRSVGPLTSLTALKLIPVCNI